MPEWLTLKDDSALIRVKVLPNAPRNAVEERGTELLVRVSAPPDKGRANEELVRYLSKLLGVARRSIDLVSGQTARHKVLRLPKDAAARLVQASLSTIKSPASNSPSEEHP